MFATIRGLTPDNTETLNWDDMPGTAKMYVLYIERPVSVPDVPFHDRGTYKECIAVFDDIKTLDVYTKCRFGMPYSVREELERMQDQEATRTKNAERMYVTDNQYGVDIVPMFTDIESIPEYARKMTPSDNILTYDTCTSP